MQWAIINYVTLLDNKRLRPNHKKLFNCGKTLLLYWDVYLLMKCMNMRKKFLVPIMSFIQ
jgi:hypothetical protein